MCIGICGLCLCVCVFNPTEIYFEINRDNCVSTQDCLADSQVSQPLRQIQQLSEGAPGEAEDDGARQVILILPDKFSEQTGDVAALLPSLGLAPSPSDCVSIVTVQPKDAAEGGHAPPSQVCFPGRLPLLPRLWIVFLFGRN